MLSLIYGSIKAILERIMLRRRVDGEDYALAFEDITPSVAEEWLKQQFEGQRKLREHHVIMLAQEMENRSFIPHSSIVFADLAEHSYLIDGQHRLAAIALYGKAVRMPVLRREATSIGEVREWYASIDQGLRRTARDAIRAQGLTEELHLTERQAGRLSGAVKLIATGFMDVTAKVSSVDRKDRAKSRSNAAVSRLMRSWAKEAQTYFEAVHGGEPQNMYLFDRAAVIACAILTMRHVPEKAVEFWSGMSRDDGLSRGDPRKRYLLWLRDGKHRAGDAARGFAVAWRAFLDQRDVTLIRIDSRRSVEIRGVPLEKEITAALALVTSDVDDDLELPLDETAMS